MTFFISLFILLMQFIWLYIDDMMGKGIKWYVIVELLVYSSANLVPLALPLAILLASLMTFGNMGEHFELVSFKAAGISLQKVMQPLIVFVLVVSIGAFFFANNVIPKANLKFYSLLHDIRVQKPAMNIKPNMFYNEMEGLTIRIKSKSLLDNGDEMLRNIMIYDHNEDHGNRKLTIADSGVMSMSEDKSRFIIKLYNGTDYQEEYEDKNGKVYPLTRFTFEENEVSIDMTMFQFNRTDEDLFKDDYRMFNLSQLNKRIDSLSSELENRHSGYYESIFYTYNDTINKPSNQIKKTKLLPSKYVETSSKGRHNQIYGVAINNARTNKGRASAAGTELKFKEKVIVQLKIEWHRKLTFSIACLIMFFIGAPLGAIVQKGGLGMPVIISVVFFLLFWVMSISGEKMANEFVILPHEGMWMATGFLFPLGIFFTYKATTDSEMFNIGGYITSIKTFFNKLSKNK